MPFAITALAAAAMAPPPAAAPPPPALTIEDARTLPPEMVAEIALRQIAARVRGVTRPTYDSLLAPDLPLYALDFALEPRSSAFVGLCEATIVQISFYNRYEGGEAGRNRPVRAQDITTSLRYKVLADVVPNAALPLETFQRQQSLCHQERKVVWPEDKTLGHRAFFQFQGDLSVAWAVALLQRVVRDVEGGRYADHRCVGWQPCADSGQVLRALSFDDLRSIRVTRDPADANRYTLKASFLISGGHSTIVTNEIEVEAMLSGHPLELQRIGPTRITRGTLIRD